MTLKSLNLNYKPRFGGAFSYLQLVRVTYRFNSPEFPDSSYFNHQKIFGSSKYRSATVLTDKYSKGRHVQPSGNKKGYRSSLDVISVYAICLAVAPVTES